MQTNRFITSGASWITTIFFALFFYGLGAGMMDSFVIYHTWKFIGHAEFANAHIESGSRIVSFFVLPMLLMTVFLILLFWHRPSVISRGLVWMALVCTIVPWLSSAFIQIPMQLQLSKGKDEVLLQQLITTDWIRIIPTWVMAVIVFLMLKKCVSPNSAQV
jgi:hypothetical protein